MNQPSMRLNRVYFLIALFLLSLLSPNGAWGQTQDARKPLRQAMLQSVVATVLPTALGTFLVQKEGTAAVMTGSLLGVGGLIGGASWGNFRLKDPDRGWRGIALRGLGMTLLMRKVSTYTNPCKPEDFPSNTAYEACTTEAAQARNRSLLPSMAILAVGTGYSFALMPRAARQLSQKKRANLQTVLGFTPSQTKPIPLLGLRLHY